MKTLVSAAVFAALSSSVVAETVIYIGGTEYGINEIANNTDTLSSEDLSALNAKDIGQLIQSTTSAEVTQTGGPGTLASIFFRGTESDHTTFLINGIRTNEGFNNSGRVELLNPLLADEVSIVKGSSSTLFGSTIGGVVSIDTNQITPEKLQGVSKLTLGSYGYSEFLVKKAFRGDDSAVSIGAASTKTDGIYPTTSATQKGALENQTLDLAFHKNLAFGNLKIQAFHNQGTIGYYSSNLSSPAESDFNITAASATVSDVNHALGKLNVQLSHFVSEYNESVDEGANGINDHHYTYRTSLDIQNKLNINNSLKLSTGLIFTNEDLDADASWTVFKAHTFTKEAFGQLQKTSNSNDVKLGVRIIDDQHFGNHKTWNASYTQKLTNQMSIGAASSTGFKTPTGIERLEPNYGTVDLKPETSRTNEITTTLLPNKNIELKHSIYKTKIKDSSSDKQIDGQELSIKGSINNWEYKSILTIKDPRNKDGSALLKRAKKSASFNAIYNGQNYRFSNQILYNGETTDTYGSGDKKTSSYTLFNTNLEYDLSDNIALNTKIENVFDKDYETTDGYNTPGQSFYIGLKYSGF